MSWSMQTLNATSRIAKTIFFESSNIAAKDDLLLERFSSNIFFEHRRKSKQTRSITTTWRAYGFLMFIVMICFTIKHRRP